MATATTTSEASAEAGKHLRSIHFTLMSVSFALFVSSTLSRQGEIAAATEQLSQIRKVLAVWRSGLFSHLEIGGLVDGATLLPTRRYWLERSKPRIRVQLHLRTDLWTIRPGKSTLRDIVSFEEHHEAGGRNDLQPNLSEPETLAEFEEIWDSLAEVIVHFYSGDQAHSVAYMEPMGLDEEVLRLPLKEGKLASDDCQPTSPTLILRDLPDYAPKSVDEAVLAQEFTHVLTATCTTNQFSAYRIWIPAETIERSISFQSVVNRVYGVAWKTGKFDHAFPELSRLTSDFAELRFDKIDKVLRSNLAESAERVEVFGTRFPIEQLSWWGSLALVCMQLYLTLHLQAFVSTTLLPRDLPWIALYDGYLPKAVTVVTLVLLPTAVILSLAGPRIAEGALMRRMGVGMLIAVSIVLATWALVLVLRIWRAPANATPPAETPFE